MNVSFCICVGPGYNQEYLNNIIFSIIDQPYVSDVSDDDYEIIICGDNVTLPGTLLNVCLPITIIPFDDSQSPRGWITRKKNLMVQAAKYDNIVLTHDYYLFDELWYTGLRKFDKENPDWKIMCNTVMTKEGTRSSDWLVNQRYMDEAIKAFPHFANELMSIAPGENGPRWVCGLPYDVKDLTHIQYVSGAYIVAKKDVLLECPLNETLMWGDAEDIIWSQDVVQHGFKFHFNPYCFVFIQKPNKWHLHQMTDECVECLRELFGPNEVILPEIIKLRNNNESI